MEAVLRGRRVVIESIGFRFLGQVQPQPQPQNSQAQRRLRQLSNMECTDRDLEEAVDLLGLRYDLIVNCMPLPNPEKDTSHLGLAFRVQSTIYQRNIHWYKRLFSQVGEFLRRGDGELRILCWHRIHYRGARNGNRHFGCGLWSQCARIMSAVATPHVHIAHITRTPTHTHFDVNSTQWGSERKCFELANCVEFGS